MRHKSATRGLPQILHYAKSTSFRMTFDGKKTADALTFFEALASADHCSGL